MTITVTRRVPPVDRPEDTLGDATAVPARRPSRAPLLVVALLGVAFLVHASPWIAAPFGESHDGRNAAVWGLASHGLLDDPIGSRLGGTPPRGAEAYAHHPPLIIAETALAESIGGQHRVVTRSPAWLGSLVALALLAVLLLDAGLSPTAASAGIVVAFGSGMFLTYGTLLDTPVTSLPFALALLIAWQRARQGRPWPAWVFGVTAALTALAGWEALAIGGIAGLALAFDAWRGRVPRRQVAALGIGLAVGLALTLGWVAWVYGSLAPLIDRTDGRASGIDLLTATGESLGHARDLFPYALVIGVLAALVSWRDRRGRTLMLVSTTAVLGYAAAFHTAAYIHDYWNYLLLVPLAVATARGAQKLLDARLDASPRLVAGVLLAVACVPLALSVARPSVAEQLQVNGIAAGRLAEIAGRGARPGQPAMGYLTPVDTRVDSLDYESGWATVMIRTREELRSVARRDPSFPVITTLLNPKRAAVLRREAIAVDGVYALVRAQDCYDAGCGG